MVVVVAGDGAAAAAPWLLKAINYHNCDITASTCNSLNEAISWSNNNHVFSLINSISTHTSSGGGTLEDIKLNANHNANFLIKCCTSGRLPLGSLARVSLPKNIFTQQLTRQQQWRQWQQQ